MSEWKECLHIYTQHVRRFSLGKGTLGIRLRKGRVERNNVLGQTFHCWKICEIVNLKCYPFACLKSISLVRLCERRRSHSRCGENKTRKRKRDLPKKRKRSFATDENLSWIPTELCWILKFQVFLWSSQAGVKNQEKCCEFSFFFLHAACTIWKFIHERLLHSELCRGSNLLNFDSSSLYFFFGISNWWKNKRFPFCLLTPSTPTFSLSHLYSKSFPETLNIMTMMTSFNAYQRDRLTNSLNFWWQKRKKDGAKIHLKLFHLRM